MPDKDATVSSVVASRTTADQGEYIQFNITVEGVGLEMVHQGDLVLEVDGETVYTDEGFYIGDEIVDVEVPVQFKDTGSHDICGTLMNITATNIPA
jgi:hypothetical protein